LEVHPEALRRSECPGQLHGHLSRNPPPTAADLVDPGDVGAEMPRQLRLRNTLIVQHFLENGSRMNSYRKIVGMASHGHTLSMVIGDLDILRTLRGPYEAYSILIVYPYRMLSSTIVTQSMKV
jgi:hypothetical protein